ncbi:MAG: HigA family addiction module antitoxin [Pseudonocardiaceae bacterium]
MTAPLTMPPIHPGEVLLQEYLEPLGVTQHRLAVAIAVPPRRINEIVHGSDGSAPTPRCDLRGIPEPPSVSG